MRRFGQILLYIVLIVLTSGAVFCEDFSRPVVIATTVVSATETEETALGKVILDSAVLQLRLEGFEVRVVDSSALPPPKDEQDFLIISEYQVIGGFSQPFF